VIEQTADMKSGAILKQGYLLKRSHNIQLSWKKRWFVLRHERLNIYKDEREYQLLRIIKLRETKLRSKDTKNHREHTLALAMPSKNYHLQASSEQERAEWVEALVQAGAPLAELSHDNILAGLDANVNANLTGNANLNPNPNPTSSPSLSPQNPPGSPGGKQADDEKIAKIKKERRFSDNISQAIAKAYQSDDNENTSESEDEFTGNALEKIPEEGVIKQSYLMKQTLVRKKWKKRWVVLREKGKLMYYKNDQEYELLKMIKLHHSTEIFQAPADKQHKKPFVFHLVTPKRVFYFAANSEEEMQEWITCLNANKEKHSQLATEEDLQPTTSPKEHPRKISHQEANNPPPLSLD